MVGQVRDQVLHEATRLLARHGFEGTSLQAVADAVGVKKPSVLYHFKSKEDLRQAVLDSLLSRWSEVVPRLLMASTRTGLAKFEAVIGELVGFFADDPDRARILVRELLDRPEQMQEILQRQVRPWVEVVAEYIREGQRTGTVRPDVDPEPYVLHVVSMALFSLATTPAASPLFEGGGRGPVERTVGELVRLAKAALFVDGYVRHQDDKRARQGGAGR
ncbi:MAG: TetR/AcrR family transcriptional regulator [Myxococcales bacterium]|nr:TetR/AcrR family transcriptional regulator [Myxococcales bacterium]MCB9648721.1 TetR/AcrR family transcriptional regulator [Deltaproteobacteria bacterium]